MRSKFLTWVSAVSAVALVSGILVLSANAQIGASSSPLVTDGPNLISAEANGDEAHVCFNDEVSEVGDDAGTDFHVVDTDAAANIDGTNVELGGTDECVDVEFGDAGRDVDTFSILEIDDGAVEDRAGDQSVKNAVAIDGADLAAGAGRTSAPNLLDFDVNETSGVITYMFDRDVNCADIADATAFWAVDDDGDQDNSDNGGGLGDCDGDEVDADFTGSATDPTTTDQIEHVGVNSDVIGTDAGEIHEDGAAAVSGEDTGLEGVGSSVPDFAEVTDAERTDDDTWEITFDMNLDACTAGLVFLYGEDGQEYTADDCSTDDRILEVRVDDAGVEDSTDSELPLISADEGAVTDDTNSFDSIPGSAAVGSTEEAGFSDAPDLEGVRKIAADIIAFDFDENVDEDNAGFDDECGDFNAVNQEGDEVAAVDQDDVQDNTVTCEFDESDVSEAVGGSVEFDSVFDFLGNSNVNGAAGADNRASSGGTTSGGTATTTSSTTTTVTTGGTQTRRIPTTLTGRYAKKAGAFKGSVGSARSQCIRGRLVSILKRGKVKGTDTSARNGSWKIRSPKAKGRYKAHVAKKVFTASNGDKIVCLADDSPAIRVRRR